MIPRSSVMLLAATVALLALAFVPTTFSASADVRISEIRIDQPSYDTDEYLELTGPAGTDLSNLTYVVIGDGTGGSGVIEAVVSLSGQSIPYSGYFVVAESSFTFGTVNLMADLDFENDDNVTHLLVEGFSGAQGDDLDTDDDGVLDLMPWTNEISRIALIKEDNPPSTTEYHYGPPTVGPDGNYVPAHVFACPEGDAWRIGEYSPDSGLDSPGQANACGIAGDFGTCGDEAALIHEVQGNIPISPLAGQIVVVEAVLHGDFQDADELKGFFLQEEDGDADGNPQTSEGIFVDDEGFGTDIQPGDLIRVQGLVEESYGKTQLSDISNLAVCGSGMTVTPATVMLPVDDLIRWEEREGMALILNQTLVVTDNFTQGRYGEVGLSLDERLFSPTGIATPGEPAIVTQEANDLRRILLDDGSRDQNPEPPPFFAADGTLRAGDTLSGLNGALDYDFGAYRIHPTENINFTRLNERSPQPDDVGGSLTVATFNVLNYFTTLDDGMDICGPSATMECRGADTAEEFQRQREKIIAALQQMDADVVGLIEIENNPIEAVADLVAGLNQVMGPGTYSYIDTGTIGSDAIKVALIFKPATLIPLGSYAILDSSVDPDFIDDLNRPTLAQTFQEVATGEALTLAVNHLKSKGSSCNSVGDPDIGDGQGNCNLTRTSAAVSLAKWLDTDPTDSGDPDRLIIGDLNAYAVEDPIWALTSRGYADLVKNYMPLEERYSYVFFGQAGYLDHAMASPSLVRQVNGATIWHINSDEPSALDYNNYNQASLYQAGPYRSSDHDPIIIGLQLGDYVDMNDIYLPILTTP